MDGLTQAHKMDLNLGIDMSDLTTFYDAHQQDILEDFKAFLRFQSISSEPEYKQHVRSCADWVADYLRRQGLEVEYWESAGHPVLFAEDLTAGPDKPTVLIYNHYDVQPVDPLELWKTPPFEPDVRNGDIFARGAQDNKGQCFYVLQVIRALKQLGTLPVNIKLCIEGEEECGSPGLTHLVKEKAERLKADYLLIVDVAIKGPEKPAIGLSVRGLVALDVHCRGSQTDLHSGLHGGIVFNPIHALVEILASLRDAEGRILVPGFYDGIQELSPAQKELLDLSFDPQEYFEEVGAVATGGERHLPPLERVGLRPTIEINGIIGGYTGSGVKTVIPAVASAKLTCRLVPNQEPEIVGSMVADYLQKQAPTGIEVTTHVHPGRGKAVRTQPGSKLVQAAAQSYEDIFKTPCSYVLDGGSIPISAELQAASGAEILFMGMGLSGDQIHAPNEHFGLERLRKGFLVLATLLRKLGSCSLW